MIQPSRRQMPAASSRDRLVSADLEAPLGYDSAEYHSLMMVLDGYLDGRFTLTAYWMWLYKTLYYSDNLDLLERCKIFLLDRHRQLELDGFTQYVDDLNPDEGFEKLWFNLGLPVGQAKSEDLDRQRRVENIMAKELERREARARRLNRVDQPAHDKNNNTAQAQSSTYTKMTDPNMSKHPVKQFGSSTQSAINDDADISQQSSKLPGPQLEQSDFTFKMARDGGPVMASSMPVDMLVASVVSTATPATKSALKEAANDATELTSTHEIVSASKFPEPIIVTHKPAAFDKSHVSTETIKHVKTIAPVITAAPGVGKKPAWKSPWKRNMAVVAQFPNIDLRPTFDPDQSPDQYIEPLSDDEPDLSKMTEEEKGRAVYNQLLNLGERQKAVTGKYRSVADDIKAQTEAEKKAQQAQKESEDVGMGGQ